MTQVDFSIINLRNCLLAKRIDAEYFKNDYLQNEEIIAKKEYEPLDKITRDIKSYGAYSLTNLISYTVNGIPYIRCTDVKEGYVDFSNVLFVNDKSHELLWKSEVKPNMVLLCMSGSVGNCAVADKDWKYPINSNQDIAKIELKENYNPYFVATFFNCRYGKKQILRLPIGSVQQHIFIWQIKTILVPKASNLLQTKIEEIVLKSNFSKQQSTKILTELNNKIEHTLSLDTIHISSQNYVTHTFKEYLDNKRLDGEYWLPKYDQIEEKIKSYPNGFDSLDNLIKVSSDSVKVEADKNYRYVELANVNAGIGLIEEPSELFGSELPSRARMKLKKNDVVVSTVEGSADKVAIVLEEVGNLIGSTGFFVLRANYFLPEVILALLRTPYINALYKRQAQGTILTAVPRSSLSRVFLPKLSPSYQEEIATQVKEAHGLYMKSRELLEVAKKAVEIFIEESEESALSYIKQNYEQV